MKLACEFTVAAPLEPVWRDLLDFEELTACFRGAEHLRPRRGEQLHAGSLTLGAGGGDTACHASLRKIDSDEDVHVTTVRIHGHHDRGPAIASGVVTGRAVEVDMGTRVALTADLELAGQHAAHELVEGIAHSLFDEFAHHLERRMIRHARTFGTEESGPERKPASNRARGVAAAAAGPLQQYGIAAAGIVLFSWLCLERRPRRVVSLSVKYRW